MSVREGYFVSRTMHAIEVLAFQSATAPELAGALQVHPRTARRLLNRLVDDGWLTRTEGRHRRYSPTRRIVALAAHYADRSPLVAAARPEVEALRAASGRSALLAIPSYRSTLRLVYEIAPGDDQPSAPELAPAHATAAGKVLLAHRPEWRESVFELPLDALTAATIVDPDTHRREASALIERGYGCDVGEYRERLVSIAAPVSSPDGDVVAALGVSFTAPRISERDAEAIGREVAEFAGRVSAALARATSSDSAPAGPD
jgi:DNA-binding IclR family transcriptional regulator